MNHILNHFLKHYFAEARPIIRDVVFEASNLMYTLKGLTVCFKDL